MTIDQHTLQQIAATVDNFPTTKWHGLSADEVQRSGSYTENGLTFVREDLPLGQLYAGLTVLCRDMYFYLDKNPRDDSAVFDEILSQVIARERSKYGTSAFPEYTTLPIRIEPPLPLGLAARFDEGATDVEPLGNPQIVHEWTSKPGKRIAAKFVERARPVICDPNGIYSLFHDKKVEKKDRVTSVAEAILVGALTSSATIWYALVVFVAAIVVKLGITRFCEGKTLLIEGA